MAAHSIPSASHAEKILQSIDILIEKCRTTTLFDLFNRHIEASNENSTKRNIAIAVLTAACFDEKKVHEVPVFGGFNTTDCRNAIIRLRVHYTENLPGETAHLLYDRRGVLFKIFQEKLTQAFGAENTDAIPRQYQKKAILSIRENLFRMGCSLRMVTPSSDGTIPLPRPFKAVLDPLNQINNKETVQYDYPWISPTQQLYPLLFKKILLVKALEPALSAQNTPLQVRTRQIVAGRPRCPNSIIELIGCLFCRGLPFRVRVEDGEELDVFGVRAE